MAAPYGMRPSFGCIGVNQLEDNPMTLHSDNPNSVHFWTLRYSNALIAAGKKLKQQEELERYRVVSGNTSATSVPTDFDPNAVENILF